MATVILYGDPSDGYIQSTDATFATARSGSVFTVTTAIGTLVIGQNFNGPASTYSVLEGFFSFNTSGLVNPTASTLSLWCTSTTSGTNFTAEVRPYDWGTSLTSADWAAGDSLGSLTLLATYDTTGLVSSSYFDFIESSGALTSNLNLSGSTRVFVSSSRTRLSTTPLGSSEQFFVNDTDASGTTQDPKLTITVTTPTSGDEILNPFLDQENNGWTTDSSGTTSLYAAIDETTASDADYIQSPVGPTTAQYYETALETHADPASSTGHIVHYRYQKNIAGGNVDLTVGLLQGSGLEQLTTNQQGLETNTSGWVGVANGTILRTTTAAHSGAASLELTGTNSSGQVVSTTQGTGAIPTVPGQWPRLSAWVEAASTVRTASLQAWWFDSGGTSITTTTVNTVVESASSWSQLLGTVVTPATAAFVAVRLSYSGGALDEQHYIDDISLSLPVASWTHTNIPNTWTQQDQTLTSGEADSITDYSNLRLRFTPSTTTSDVVPTFVADRATANSNSAVTTVDLVLTSLTVGNWLIIRAAADNSGGGGAARSCTMSNFSGTAIDIVGGGTSVYQQNNDPGAASAGVTCNLVIAKITATSGTVRMTYGGSVVQACVAEEWSGIWTVVPIQDDPPSGANGVNSTNLASITDSSIALGNLAYGVMAVEGPTSDTYTQDADTTNGSWSNLTKLGTSNATADTNMTVYGGYKAVTATGSQTYNPTINNARDSAGFLVEFIAAPATIKTQVSWANFELPAGVTAVPHYAGINAGVNWPVDGVVNAGSSDAG